MQLPPDHARRMTLARQSLDGLSVGDAFGERFFKPPAVLEMLLGPRALPAAPWQWTDDTAMALSIVETLDRTAGIDRDHLAAAFARRYAAEPWRGYGGGAHDILTAIARGVPWAEAAGDAFDGQGSMGNGGAMRVAPVGAYFADDLNAVARQAARSADPTHKHPEGRAGAVAVAVAAAIAARAAARGELPPPERLLAEVAALTPPGPTREGIAQAATLLGTTATEAAAILGSGQAVLSSDTVPFALLAAARHLHDYEEALWFTVTGLGDRDTTCAIAGGIVALTAPIPAAFLAAREPLPAGV